MKKSFLLLLIICVSLICTGCNGNITRSIRQDGFVINERKFVCSTLVPEKKMFSKEQKNTTEKIKFIDSGMVISENGNMYELSFNGVFSNNMNCKKVGSNIKVKSMIDNEVILGEDGRYYYLGASDNIIKYSEVPRTDPSLGVYKLILGDDNVIKAMSVNSNIKSYYVLKKNGNIYNYVLKQNDATKEYYVLTDNLAYRASDFDGNIVDFKYFGEANSTYFRTEKSIYRMLSTNLSECSKYVDVACKYELKKDEVLSNNMDRYLGYGGTVLITDYGKIFTVGS